MKNTAGNYLQKLTLSFLTAVFTFTANINSYANVEGSHKISGEMVANGDIRPYPEISSDSRYVVYRADQDQNNVTELYSYSVDNDNVTKLNETLSLGKNVISFLISPDSKRVVYLADQDTNGVNELYSVSITGGTPAKLNLSENSFEGVEPTYNISPDSNRVVYVTLHTGNTRNIYSVPIAGGSSINFNESTPRLASYSFEISSDSTRVVYISVLNGERELISTLIIGGELLKISLPLNPEERFASYIISPDSQFVVYQVSRGLNQDEEVDTYSASIAGGDVIKLNIDFVGPRQSGKSKISPDSSMVLLEKKFVAINNDFSNQTDAIYKVSIQGGDAIKLNPDLDAATGILRNSIQISENNIYVVYESKKINADGTKTHALHKVEIANAGSAQLIKQLNPDNFFYRVGISNNGNHLVFTSSEDNQKRELFSSALAGNNIIQLSNVVINGGIDNFIITLDGKKVVYRGDQDKNNVYEIYIISIDGGQSEKLNDKLVQGGDVEFDGYEISPNGEFIIYTADQDLLHQLELYIATTNVPPSTSDFCFPIKNYQSTTSILCL